MGPIWCNIDSKIAYPLFQAWTLLHYVLYIVSYGIYVIVASSFDDASYE